MEDTETYTLYIFPFSLYSIMARLTIVLGMTHPHRPPTRALPRVDLKLLNLHRDENLSEEFLKLNPKGQVPVMTSKGREALTDSLDISLFFGREYFHELFPHAHKAGIEKLLADLHAIEGFSLSVKEEKVKPGWEVEILDPGLEKLLGRDEFSEEYLKALRFKKQL